MTTNKWSHPLVTGTVILTLTGLVSRFIGFFYRIFLSNVFGAEGMGLYQLISPVLALSFSLTVSGIQTAISKYVAAETATRDYKNSFRTLWAGFLLAMALSAVCASVIYGYAEPIAADLLLEERTAPLLRIIALSIPMASVHSCINGYFYGIRKTAIPAFSQLAEQICRVGSVYLIAYFCEKEGYTLTISFAVVGLVIGESASMLVSVVAILARAHSLFPAHGYIPVRKAFPAFSAYQRITGQLLRLAVPLSANRLVLNLLQSVEAIYIPNRLMAYGLNNADALSVYGVLTGMSLPLILFPSALTNSISVLLLPIVAEADASGNESAVRRAIFTSIRYCLLLGFFCTALFLLFGRLAGRLLFHSELAGSFILTLSFICPFMYIASTLNSILNGLGKTVRTFLFSVISLCLRLFFVFFAIPLYGIKGYLWGILASQMLQTFLCTISALRISRKARQK
ncbi:MAG: polysaccharide biosynthesis protein [Bacteroidales bacterium]|nr:polysaccharide biosynthesis protein [Bacteroidales bacterium]MCM1415313.1 polysaccharide biosynthesis protein [bacterium]MCM1423468.1 polysaccharide biosynthesis protein [bacterium]